MAARLPVKKVEITDELEKLVGDWFEKKQASDLASENENAARLVLYAHFYAENDPLRSEAGKEKFSMPGGWQLEIERRINARIDRATLATCKAAIDALPPDPDTGEVPSLDAIIRWEPKLSDSNYKTAPDRVKEILGECLTFTPGSPGLKLEQKVTANPKAMPINPFAKS